MADVPTTPLEKFDAFAADSITRCRQQAEQLARENGLADNAALTARQEIILKVLENANATTRLNIAAIMAR